LVWLGAERLKLSTIASESTMNRSESHNNAMTLIAEMVRAGKLINSGTSDPKIAAAFLANQVKEWHEIFTKYFATYDLDKK
jgi:hypothetical protein